MAFNLLNMLGIGGQSQVQPNMLTAAAQPQAVPQAPQAPSLLDRYQNFTASDRGRALNDFFTGIAMGQNPQQSLGYGAKLVSAGSADRRSKQQSTEQRNQTVEWLKGKGLSDQDAALLAGNTPALSEYLKNTLAPDAQKPTSDIQNYQFAVQQGFKGNFADWAKGKENHAPARVQEYEYAKQQGFPGSFNDWLASQKGGMSLQVDPETGAVSFQQGGNIKPMTEGQSKDTTYATRAEGALPILDKYGNSLTSLGESVGGSLPVVGNYAKSADYQQAEQAGTEFLQAILRKDTGAAITPQETAEYGKVYLPRPGDSQEVLAQKKTSRKRALEALKAGMTPQAILAQERALTKIGSTPDDSGGQSDPLGIR
jgi:hypothetical protein